MSTIDYKRKMEAASGSPTKKAALGNWDSSIFAKESPPAVVPLKKWIETPGASDKMLQLLAPSTAGVAFLTEAKHIQILSLPALSQDQKSIIGHAGVDFGDNPRPIGLDLLEVSRSKDSWNWRERRGTSIEGLGDFPPRSHFSQIRTLRSKRL